MIYLKLHWRRADRIIIHYNVTLEFSLHATVASFQAVHKYISSPFLLKKNHLLSLETCCTCTSLLCSLSDVTLDSCDVTVVLICSSINDAPFSFSENTQYLLMISEKLYFINKFQSHYVGNTKSVI